MLERRPLSEAASLPAPSAELVIIRTGAQAVIRALGRRKGEKFIKEWMELLASEAAVEALLPIRPQHERAAVADAQREAMAWLRQVAPTLIASLPPE